MYCIYKQTTNAATPIVIASCRTKLNAASACRNFYDMYVEETGSIPYRIFFRKVQPYWQVRLNYYILRIVRGMEESKLEGLRAAEKKATTKRTKQEEVVASLF